MPTPPDEPAKIPNGASAPDAPDPAAEPGDAGIPRPPSVPAPPPPPSRERALRAVKVMRELLPGDSKYGDSLSTAGDDAPQTLARRLADASEEHPSVLREAGLSALQVWEAMTAGGGSDKGEREMTIAFTDLVSFSKWALKAGDEDAVRLLREVGEAIEPPVRANAGKVIKHIGDGMMAAFDQPADAINAIFEMQKRLALVEVASYRPRIRAGLHHGHPRKVGNDYLGVDVNIAARVADAASADEVLISDLVVAELPEGAFRTKRKLLFRAKGVPADLTVYSVKPARP